MPLYPVLVDFLRYALLRLFAANICCLTNVSSYMALHLYTQQTRVTEPHCHTGAATGCPALADRKNACRLCSRLSMSAISALASA